MEDSSRIRKETVHGQPQRTEQILQRSQQLQQPTQYLMLFSIGPVQEFIAQARKTRDLWFGSYVLSEISKKAARELSEVHKAKMIFPYLDQNMTKVELDYLRVANKVQAIVTTDNPRQVALDVKRAVTFKWLDYANKAKKRLGDSIIGPMWERQVKDLIEFFAVWSVLEGKYEDVLKQTEQLMAARKTLRDYRPNEPANRFGDAKSSLDGGRESVLKTGKYASYAGFGIKPKEELDAISLVKRLSRFIGHEREFKSVCDVAFRQFEDEVRKPKNLKMKDKVDSFYRDIREDLKEYLDVSKLAGGKADTYDSRMFYPNRIEEAITELMTEQQAFTLLIEKWPEKMTQSITRKLDILYNEIKRRPTSYYALIVGDGDHMGNCLRGMSTVEEHQKFTEQLSRFASQVDSIVTQRYAGQMIYSGGDDVMALLPLHHCLDAAGEIQQEFIHIMKQAVPEGTSLPTFSVGIAIVHMMEPLEESLQLARSIEALAKVRRDSLAIYFQKRSGSEEMKVSLPFGDQPVETINKMKSLYESGYISSGFAYALRQLHAEYMNLQAHKTVPQEGLGELLLQEVRRLIIRKKPAHISTDNMVGEVLPIFAGLQELGEKSHSDSLALLHRLAEQCVIAITLEKVGGTDGTQHTDSAS
ncbi:type III-B CRISPR-associated protein Cas10/Cmr2 [Paenibacillus polymyxa]|uniref:type III-B CRISPR-associated protein Cas10/Cmr2 n=1 Tax=Paenibacillus polymyxa TaxID=1406 RepID=UPI001F593A00|nr:type III-B CRISPR-associated protein Cas10/Cmr2 [Paenibacillus polymyxa]UNL93213.1 type III-B CRISPR-associated protein Cas10/Cmr2 [Paenibacillus polymyxa]